MENPRSLQPVNDHKIVAVDLLSVGLLVAFEDGKEYIYSPEELHALVPEEFDLVKHIERLIS